MHIGVVIVEMFQWVRNVRLVFFFGDVWENFIYAFFLLCLQVGLRRRTYTVLSGSVLAVWSRVEHTLNAKCGASNNKMQVIRLKTTEGGKIVGTLIPKNCVESLVADLSSDAEKVDEQTFTTK